MKELKLEVKKLELRKVKQAICINQNSGGCCETSSGCDCLTSGCCTSGCC